MILLICLHLKHATPSISCQMKPSKSAQIADKARHLSSRILNNNNFKQQKQQQQKRQQTKKADKMFNIFVKSLKWHFALFEIIICICAKCSCFNLLL